MPPVCIHVGDGEVLLDDSLRYAERAVAVGVDARADVWMGMPHGFPLINETGGPTPTDVVPVDLVSFP
jgi:acetyl esterase/lipase